MGKPLEKTVKRPQVFKNSLRKLQCNLVIAINHRKYNTAYLFSSNRQVQVVWEELHFSNLGKMVTLKGDVHGRIIVGDEQVRYTYNSRTLFR
jgi:hypothetical protein